MAAAHARGVGSFGRGGAVVRRLGAQILYAEITAECTGEVAKECITLQINAPMVESLQSIGISLDRFALMVTFFDALPPLLALLVSGLIVIWRGDDRTAALAGIALLLFVGVVLQSGVTALADQPGWRSPVTFVQFLGSALLFCIVNLFPDGRFVPTWTRWIALAAIVWCAIGYFSPSDWAVNQHPPGSLFPVGIVPLFLASVTGQGVRYFRDSNQLQRQQMKWVLLGFSASLTVILFNALIAPRFVPAPPQPAAAVYLLIGGGSFSLALLLMPISVALAVMRYRLFDVDLLISRALVYIGLSAGIVVVYVLVVAYLGALFQNGGSLPNSLLATAVVAVAFQPVRERLQRAVNHLVYGDPDNPYVILTRLAQRLEGSLPAESVLPAVVLARRARLHMPRV
ncbi:MAG: hypothetical protein JO020_23470 [Chloroflexi bacterium]|nr:hypothetical protein [Chloroflexota bacterium]